MDESKCSWCGDPIADHIKSCDKDKVYEWQLKWSGCRDGQMLRASVEHLLVFPLWRASKAKVIEYKEYTQMVDADQIEPPKSYWAIRQDEVGVISRTSYSRYNSTWEMIGSAHSDFCDGWRALKKVVNKELSHEIAIKIDKLLTKIKKIGCATPEEQGIKADKLSSDIVILTREVTR